MRSKPRYGWFFDTAVAVLKPIARLLFNFEYEALDIEGPALVLCNHNTDFDCFFLACAINSTLSFVMTENVVRMGFLGHIATKYFDPIIHYKGTVGLSTTKNILKKLKSGKSVAMFPEGNRSFNGKTCPIPPATAKLAKATGASLVTYKFTGGYFSYPRWGTGIRKGKLAGKVANVYSAEQLAEISAEELQARIEADLYTDAYEEQKIRKIAFKGKKRAEGMESTLFRCPDCGKIGTLRSVDNSIFCECGFDAYYNEYGWLECSSGKQYTITELDEDQRNYLADLVSEQCGSSSAPELESDICKEPSTAEDSLFSDNADFSIINENHELKQKTNIKLRAFKNRFCLGDTILPFEKIRGIAINQRNLLLIHVDGIKGHYELSGSIGFNALKYLYLYRAVCGSRNGLI